jgi:hypothetical protein
MEAQEGVMRTRAMLALSLSVACLALAPAGAGDVSPLIATFGNTVHISAGDDDLYVYFNADGTFTTSGSDGQQIGTWQIKDGKICTKIKEETSCGVIEAGRQVGDEWKHTLNGETVSVAIEKGR